MKFLRIGAPGAERPAMLAPDGRLRDLSSILPDLGGANVTRDALARLSELDPQSLPELAPGQRIGPCLSHVPSFHCIGLNYRKHAAESGMEPPSEPILFNKAASALSGPYDPILRPPGSHQLDYEVELGVVIGAVCEQVSEAAALDHVAGYCLVNDVSERAFQTQHLGQWVKGKSAPSFGPVGPWLVPAAALPDPQDLACWTKVNGALRQSSSTADMIFSVAEIISYMSRFMRLVPGDLIATGTPAGVAMGMGDPAAYLHPGDVVQIGITGLGEQENRVVDYGG